MLRIKCDESAFNMSIKAVVEQLSDLTGRPALIMVRAR